MFQAKVISTSGIKACNVVRMTATAMAVNSDSEGLLLKHDPYISCKY